MFVFIIFVLSIFLILSRSRLITSYISIHIFLNWCLIGFLCFSSKSRSRAVNELINMVVELLFKRETLQTKAMIDTGANTCITSSLSCYLHIYECDKGFRRSHCSDIPNCLQKIFIEKHMILQHFQNGSNLMTRWYLSIKTLFLLKSISLSKMYSLLHFN